MLGLLLLAVQAAAPPAPPAPARGQLLRVATASVAPFVLPDSDPPAGFSIDLWREVALRLQVESTWSRVPLEDLVPAVQRGQADLAIAAITMTPERERVVDFAYPYFDSGLQILVRTVDDGRLQDLVRAVPWRALWELLLIGITVLLLLAHVLWLIERRSNADFRRPYPAAIGEGMWATLLIIATGEYGDRQAPGLVKRIAVGGMWVLGMVLLAQLTATVTSSQTVARLQSTIQGPGDLPGHVIATVPGSTAEGYLVGKGIKPVAVHSADESIDQLLRGEVQAIVFDAPTLQYWAAQRGNGRLRVVGPVFRPEKYGIAVPEGSPLREQIDEALLAMYTDGTYEAIHSRWFSPGH
jgi:ABC-type amino acid transport substrate-binding protein